MPVLKGQTSWTANIFGCSANVASNSSIKSITKYRILKKDVNILVNSTLLLWWLIWGYQLHKGKKVQNSNSQVI